jgi:hypothetical protein
LFSPFNLIVGNVAIAFITAYGKARAKGQKTDAENNKPSVSRGLYDDGIFRSECGRDRKVSV